MKSKKKDGGQPVPACAPSAARSPPLGAPRISTMLINFVA